MFTAVIIIVVAAWTCAMLVELYIHWNSVICWQRGHDWSCRIDDQNSFLYFGTMHCARCGKESPVQSAW